MDHGHLPAPVLAGVIEGCPDDALRAFERVDLGRNRVLVGRQVFEGAEGFRDPGQHFHQLAGHRAELHPRIQPLRVFPEHHQVDICFVIQGIACIGPARALADVQVEHLAHAHDG